MVVRSQDGGFVSAWRGGLAASVQGELREGTVSQRGPACFLTIEGATEVRLWGASSRQGPEHGFLLPLPFQGIFLSRWNVEQGQLGESKRGGYSTLGFATLFLGHQVIPTPWLLRTLVRGGLGMASGGAWVAHLPGGSLLTHAELWCEFKKCITP